MGEKSPSYFCFREYITKSAREGCQNQSKSGSTEGMGEKSPSYFCFREYITKRAQEGCQNSIKIREALKEWEKNHPVISVLGSISQKVPKKAVKFNQNQGALKAHGRKIAQLFLF